MLMSMPRLRLGLMIRFEFGFGSAVRVRVRVGVRISVSADQLFNGASQHLLLHENMKRVPEQGCGALFPVDFSMPFPHCPLTGSGAQ